MYESDDYPRDWLPITIPHNADGSQDYICMEGYYTSESRHCLKCPPGCARCSQPNMCLECTFSFELVNGPEFSYCFPKCLEGQYRQTEYSETKDLYRNDLGLKGNYVRPALMPHQMMQTCKPCPENCAECY